MGKLSITEVAQVYARAGVPMSNQEMYVQLGLDLGDAQRVEIGTSGARHNPNTRAARWFQQTLKRLGVIEPVPGQRGHWQMTPEAMGANRQAPPATVLVAVSTALGVALWAEWESVIPRLDEPVHLCLTSPPYALRTPRRYGNPTLAEYVDFLCEAIGSVAKQLVPGGTIALNISNDLFESGSPARSIYREKLIVALAERHQLFKLDELIWHNPSRPPAPVMWSSRTRQQLNAAYEPIYLLTNDPAHWRADNRRVLQPHTDRHAKLIAAGGEKRTASNSDGAYRIRPGSYGASTPGRIPRNVLTYGHACKDQRAVKRHARERGLLPHGAPMPLSLADFLVKYLTREDDLVVDPFAGSLTTAKAAEQNGRRWLCTERQWDYLAAGAERLATGNT